MPETYPEFFSKMDRCALWVTYCRLTGPSESLYISFVPKGLGQGD